MTNSLVRYDGPDETRPVLLAVLAHPDDESFGIGGTLALYAQRGALVYLVCATRGEAGVVTDEYLSGFESAAARRENELRCAARQLGLKEVFFLGYRDSGMPGSPDNDNPDALINAPMDTVGARVAHYIRRLRPHVVITFDPIGGYRHPDHIHIHNATLKAFELSGDPAFADESALAPYRPPKLYFQTVPHGLLRWMVRLMPLVGKDPTRFGINGDIDLKSIAEVTFPTDAVVDYRPVAALRDEASRCHASQGASSLTNGFSGWVRRNFAARETFMRAYPPPSGNGKVERDLLEGIPLDRAAV